MRADRDDRVILKRWIMRARERGYMWPDEAEALLRVLKLEDA